MTDAIIEAALQELHVVLGNDLLTARIVVSAVTPLIRAGALEEAAKLAESYRISHFTDHDGRDEIATAIRSLKEQP